MNKNKIQKQTSIDLERDILTNNQMLNLFN